MFNYLFYIIFPLDFAGDDPFVGSWQKPADNNTEGVC